MTHDADYWQVLDKMRNSAPIAPHLFVPQLIIETFARLIVSHSARNICDPWAGIGRIIKLVQEITGATTASAFTQTEAEWAVGKDFAANAHWRLGEPLQLIGELQGEIDVFASVLPFGMRPNRSLLLTSSTGEKVELKDELGRLILVAATQKLSTDGVGLFVVTPSFFFSPTSVLRQFAALEVGVEAALALPSGTFAPYTTIPTYLVVIRRRPFERMFVAELSSDSTTNQQILDNLKQGKEGGALELGRFVEVLAFRGLDSVRGAERFQKAEREFGAPAVRLEDLATAINLGRFGETFEFPILDNSIFVPLIGISDVVDSMDGLTLKRQNYAQVAINPQRSDARFVARFLNSEFGRENRELSKAGAVIPKLNKQTIKNLQIFIPDLQTQKVMLETEARIAAEHNTLLALQNEVAELRRDLWASPKSTRDVNRRLSTLSTRLTGSLKQHTVERLDQWFETLPFPLASILRAWQATASQDFKTKYEHLLHFFEATAEFVSVIFLSAFNSNEALFESHKQKLTESLRKQNVNFQRATFGTWKLVVEYFGKQTRQLLMVDKDTRALCADIFADPSFALPEAVSRKELAALLSTTNKMRNDWSGHGGVVGLEEARLRNEQLLTELQKLREIFADVWSEIQMIHAVSTQLRRGVFENEIALLMGSNSEFQKEPRSMSMCLDVEQLYLAHKDASRAVRLLPLIKVGPSPQSAKNACYFFSRLERGGAKFVSYHFTDKPELTGQFDEATAAIKFLTDI